LSALGSDRPVRGPYDPLAELVNLLSAWRSSLSGLGGESLSLEEAVDSFDSLFARTPKLPLHSNVLLLLSRKAREQGRESVVGLAGYVEGRVREYLERLYSGLERACLESLPGSLIAVSGDSLTLACARGVLRGGGEVYVARHRLLSPSLFGTPGSSVRYFNLSFLYHAVKELPAPLVVSGYSVAKADAAAPPPSLEAAIVARDFGRSVFMLAPRLAIDPFFGPLSSVHAPRTVMEDEVGYPYHIPYFEAVSLSLVDVLLTEEGPVRASFEALIEAQSSVISELL
jgi:hypothetical protein